MADPAKYKSLSVPREDWEQLGVLATKTNRTRSKMIGRLIRFFMDNKGVKANGKSIKNIIAKILRTPKYKQRKVESKKKYKRKKKVSGYYFDYDGKERILYDDNQ
jgi:hypothetical protein